MDNQLSTNFFHGTVHNWLCMDFFDSTVDNQLFMDFFDSTVDNQLFMDLFNSTVDNCLSMDLLVWALRPGFLWVLTLASITNKTVKSLSALCMLVCLS